MKISELLTTLTELQQAHGDLPIVFCGLGGMDLWTIRQAYLSQWNPQAHWMAKSDLTDEACIQLDADWGDQTEWIG